MNEQLNKSLELRRKRDEFQRLVDETNCEYEESLWPNELLSRRTAIDDIRKRSAEYSGGTDAEWDVWQCLSALKHFSDLIQKQQEQIVALDAQVLARAALQQEE